VFVKSFVGQCICYPVWTISTEYDSDSC